MNKTTEQLQSVAVDYLETLIKHAADGRGPFRGTFTIFPEGVATPVFIVGTADGGAEDGEAIAVLNPDLDLLDSLRPNVAYNGGLLKEILAGKCDGMVHVWLDAYIKSPERLKLLASYTPRNSVGTAKFEVR